MTHKINPQGVAVDQGYFWQPMETCTPHAKVWLIGQDGCAVPGEWDGKETFWVGWSPRPNKPQWLKDLMRQRRQQDIEARKK